MTKKYQICHHQIRFFKLKCTKSRLGPHWGSIRRSPDPLVGWGGGYPLSIPLPARRLRCLELGAYGVAPRFSGPLNTKPCQCNQ